MFWKEESKINGGGELQQNKQLKWEVGIKKEKYITETNLTIAILVLNEELGIN